MREERTEKGIKEDRREEKRMEKGIKEDGREERTEKGIKEDGRKEEKENTDVKMRGIIKEELRKTEEKENIIILYAAESGSRAWGFASADSDYDVRFIYRREKEYYLKLCKKRDVIELPISSVLDMNGWDLDKTLKLLHHSNPTLFEWCNSPIVYQTSCYFENFKTAVNQYFRSKSGLYHYLNMAVKNYRGYLKEDQVRLKKYFYVVRPILACRWILEFETAPPMLFLELVESQAKGEIREMIEWLLDLKMNAPETKMIQKVEPLNRYIERNLTEIRELVAQMPKDETWEWENFNEMFLTAFL